MFRIIINIYIITAFLLLFKVFIFADQTTNAVVNFSNAINKFSLQLYKELIKNEINLFCSPLSLAVVLNILLIGSKNKTALEISKSLGYDTRGLSEQQSHQLFHDFLKQQNGKHDGYNLDIASSVWIQNNSDVLPNFKSTIEKLFFVQERDADFGSPLTTDAINSWVKNVTRGRIPSLIGAQLPPMTSLLFVNALYFKGKWAKVFDEIKTKNGYFYYNNGTMKTLVPMMKNRGKFKYAVSMKSQILELPYEGQEISMIFILPRTMNGLDEVENQLSNELLSQVVKNFTDYQLLVTIPKFKVSSTLDLKSALTYLGVRTAFVPGEADLSGINGKGNLFVSTAIQKAVVDVNEEGTVAAAGSKVNIVARRILPEFTADRPFLFLIRHNPSGIIMFLGRVNKL